MDEYYYAGGRRIGLTPSDKEIALDLRGAEKSEFAEAVRQLPVQSKLAQGLVIVKRRDVQQKLLKMLVAQQLVRPVYRTNASLVVLLPEVWQW